MTKTSKKALKSAIESLAAGTASRQIRIAAYALEGLPCGGWPQTQQAMRTIADNLPSNVDVDEFVFAAYAVNDASGRYTSRF
jgi:hypothetical protein